MTLPRWDSVAALYALTNSMMLTPCWPRAGPTGGAGVAAPAWICSLMKPEIFFFLGGIIWVLVCWGWCVILVALMLLMVLMVPPQKTANAVRSDLGDLAER